MKIITVTNQKGGVGKTATATALLDGLNAEGYKVLGIDLDAQGNMSTGLGAMRNSATALSLLTQEQRIGTLIQNTSAGDLIPYSPKLSNVDDLLSETGGEFKLKESIEGLKGYDYIIIDTPPQLGRITINALTACDYVLVPAQADLFSLQGVDQLSRTINTVKKYTNPSIEVAGILLTMYTGRTNVEKETSAITRMLAEELNTVVFNSTIRASVKMKEAPYNKQGIISYAPSSTVAEDYKDLIKELHERGI